MGSRFSSFASVDDLPRAIELAPAWARQPDGLNWQRVGGDSAIVQGWCEGGPCALAATLPRAATLDGPAFQHAVTRMYSDVLHHARRHGRHPLRFWNFIPGINQEVAGGLSRYMVFNAARQAGYRAVHGESAELPASVATASAVGSPDGAFHLFCVTTPVPATQVENPRQVPAYTYSKKYGPMPPCFARAMLTCAPEPTLVIGGTASVRGEDSMHACDVDLQVAETLLNLGALIESGCEHAGIAAPRRPLKTLGRLRAYVAAGVDGLGIRDVLARACAVEGHEIEMLVADLCRPDLLIEVEGVAWLAGRPRPAVLLSPEDPAPSPRRPGLGEPPPA